jgi:hypothetical protein
VTWRTGFPFTVNAGLNTSNLSPGPSGAGDASLVNANLVSPVQYLNPRSAQTINSGGAPVTGNFFFNPNSFDPNVTTGYGTAPRNLIRGPGRTNFDLSLAKLTPLSRERVTLELRVDAFNLLNHTEFQNIDSSAADLGGTFGEVTSAYPGRILQLGAHIRF